MVTPEGACPVNGLPCEQGCPGGECRRDRRRYVMVYSVRLQRYVRMRMSEAEWLRYDEKGSVD